MAWKTLIVCAALVVAACNGATQQPTTNQLHTVRVGDLDVVLLASAPVLKQGKDTFTIEFRRAGSTTLVDVGTIKVSATMPMAGMPPMMADAVAMPEGTPGRYTVNSQFTMAGTWNVGVEWDGPAGKGSAKLSTAAQ